MIYQLCSRQCQISVPVAVAVLEECCMASVDMQLLLYSGERILAHGPLVSSPEYEVLMVSYCDRSMSVVPRSSCVVNNLF